MFTSEEWNKSKWAKEQAGKRAVSIVLMPSYWKNMIYILKISGPLVRVLRLVDGEKMPPMGYIYEAMDRAKETIARAFNDNVEKYGMVFEMIDTRWSSQLHRPLHAAGYYLNPEFFYANPELEQDAEVTTGLLECIQRLVPSLEVQDKITDELSLYQKAEASFGMSIAIRQRKTRAPGKI